MKRVLFGAMAVALVTSLAPSGNAQETLVAALTTPAPLVMPTVPPQMSGPCNSRKIAGERYSRPLGGFRRALRNHRAVKVLAMGSSSTVGVGASTPAATYVAKLETNLEGLFKGLDVDVVGRGMSGEVAEGQSARMKATVEEVKPDLVVWQVGTNDALRHVEIETFKACLRRTLAWLRENRIDVVLVDPQYGEKLTSDEYYEQMVRAIAEVAAEARVLLVDRFEAMRELSRERGDRFYLTSDDLHLNDVGHACMAEQLARAIVGGVLMAGSEATPVSQQ
jgi:lysophospholipase L1-like esterase